jgi:hypothetical protein
MKAVDQPAYGRKGSEYRDPMSRALKPGHWFFTLITGMIVALGVGISERSRTKAGFFVGFVTSAIGALGFGASIVGHVSF